MSSITALKAGAGRVLRLPKVVVLFYLVNLIASLVVVAPAALLIGQRLSHSFENDRLYSNVDIAWVIETLYHFQWWPPQGIAITLASVGLLYFVLNTFLAGGALAVLHRDTEPFFSSCARHFFPLLRLMFVSLIFYGVVWGLSDAVSKAIARAREMSMEAHLWIIADWIQLSIVFLLLGIVNMIFDYGKIVCVATGQRGAIRATFAALRFVAGNSGRTLSVYWICSITGLGFLLAYYGMTQAAAQNSPFIIALVFLLRQLYTLTRMWVRLWTWSSELQLYTFNSTIVAPVPPSLGVAE